MQCPQKEESLPLTSLPPKGGPRQLCALALIHKAVYQVEMSIAIFTPLPDPNQMIWIK